MATALELFPDLAEHLSRAQQELLTPMLLEVQVAAGASCLEEGAASSHLFCIADGELEATAQVGGRPVSLGRFTAGEVLGEQRFAMPGPSRFSLRAVVPTRVLLLDAAALPVQEEAQARMTSVLYGWVCHRLAMRVRAATELLENAREGKGGPDATVLRGVHAHVA